MGKMTKNKLSRLGPVIIAVLLVYGWGHEVLSKLEYKQLYIISSSITTISGILFGFIITSYSILITIPHVRFIKILKETGHYMNLLSSIKESAILLLIVLCMFMSFVFVPEKQCCISQPLLLFLDIGMILLFETILIVLNTARKFSAIIHAL